MPSFEDYREGPSASAWVKWAFLAFLLGAALAGCGKPAYRVPRPHPTPEEISALAQPGPARPGAPAPVAEAPFQVVVDQPLILAGGAAWVRCLVPRSYGPGRRHFGIVGLFATEGNLDSVELRRLVENVPCGRHPVVCQIRTARGYEARVATLEAAGGICDSGGPEK